MCEVAVHKGDVGRHVRTCDRVSRCENECRVQSGRRNTPVCEACMETETATVAGKMPGSGGSCEWDRAGSARSCTSCPYRATDETPARTVARVKTRSGNARGELLIPRTDKGQAG